MGCYHCVCTRVSLSCADVILPTAIFRLGGDREKPVSITVPRVGSFTARLKDVSPPDSGTCVQLGSAAQVEILRPLNSSRLKNFAKLSEVTNDEYQQQIEYLVIASLQDKLVEDQMHLMNYKENQTVLHNQIFSLQSRLNATEKKMSEMATHLTSIEKQLNHHASTPMNDLDVPSISPPSTTFPSAPPSIGTLTKPSTPTASPNTPAVTPTERNVPSATPSALPTPTTS